MSRVIKLDLFLGPLTDLFLGPLTYGIILSIRSVNVAFQVAFQGLL